jgi:hypothetical protein
MNERIAELWDKAATASAAYPSGQNTSWETQVNFMEKFAELIVRECSQMVEDKFDFCGDEIIIAEQILKHFGVEE